jgi:tetratricopeptide (TPR) repeat protein
MGKPDKKRKRARRRQSSARAGAKSGIALLQRARSLWQQERYPDALRFFDRAVAQQPNDPVTLADAARAWGARFEIAKAEELLRRLEEIAGDDPAIWLLAGQSYRMIFRPERAMNCLERVIRHDSVSPDAMLELAMLYERRHRLDEAAGLVERCLGEHPQYDAARIIQARLWRRLKRADEARPLLDGIIANRQAHWVVRSQAYAELAQLYDVGGDYDRAIETVTRGKRILLSQEGSFLEVAHKESNRLSQLCESFSTEYHRRWRRQGVDRPRERVALLTGSPRSGTTLMAQVLGAHRDIAVADERGVFSTIISAKLLTSQSGSEFSADKFNAIGDDVLTEQRDRYLRYQQAALGEEIDGRLLIDKNPSIVGLIPTMLRLFPEGKLIIAVRDPRDVVVSCFFRYLPLNTVSVQYLTLERTAARYAEEMSLWLRMREQLPEGWLEVRYEDVVDDVAGQAGRMADFLEIGWDEAMLDYRQASTLGQVDSPTYEQVAQPIYRSAMGRWRNYASHLDPILSVLEPFVRQFGYDV